ncbi:MAG: hypothetical protein K8H88_06225 [Sandaracinaceae bacterium]|nr:hypothetical protein [Sandaracinaceae bacterium]
MTKLLAIAIVCNAWLLAPAVTQAQTNTGQADTGQEAMPQEGWSGESGQASYDAQPPPPPQEPAEAPDGVRFRGGIAAAGGGEFVSDFVFGMGGVEGRAGVQLNNLIGIYLQPYLAFGYGSVGIVSGFTATAGASALIDFTFADRFFVGLGGGFGVLNNPVGPEIHVRVGGYPVMSVGGDGYSRQGLMLGVDARMFFLFSGSNVLPVAQIMGSIGYEVF